MLRDALPAPASRVRVERRALNKSSDSRRQGLRVPTSTYRLQLNGAFDFRAAAAVVDYLAKLGVNDCYLSPYFKAVPGSTHGYDVCDHGVLNPELGSDQDYHRLAHALRSRRMGQLVDFVPNHMAVEAVNNPWWGDVLANGPASVFASFFDIDWSPAKPELHNKVLLPILEDHYGRELGRGRFRLELDNGAFQLRYGSHTLPVNPRTVPRLLEADVGLLAASLGEQHPDLLELMSISTALRNLPPEDEQAPERRSERHREKDVARERLQRLIERSAEVLAHLQRTLDRLNAIDKDQGKELHAFLEEQSYRLAHWRTAADEINYRRFFDVNELAGLRMNEDQVFTYAHSRVFRLIADGAVTGIRLDHIDGLLDPTQYLERLQRDVASARDTGTLPAGADPSAAPFYCVVEKILLRGESLPESWPVAGTTGYDFLNEVNGLFVDPANQRKVLTVYHRFTGQRRSFRDVAYESKRLIIDGPMASEMNMLAHALNRLSEGNPRTRDFTLNSLRRALREVIACFPMYRVYITADGLSPADRARVERAVHEARRHNRTLEPSIFEFVRDVIVGGGPAANGSLEQWRELAMKLQQYTGPVQAKGIEDTAFYRYLPLVSVNEVGGDPDRLGVPPEEFHRANVRRRARWPYGLLASTTHDTKRSEDVRARINVLSELPEEWGDQVSTWARLNSANRSMIDGVRVPERNEEYLFYQTLIGAWPSGRGQREVADEFVVRMREYMLKATREAKVNTSWMYPRAQYEAGLTRFVEQTLCGPTSRRFLEAFIPFHEKIARWGMLNGLAQLVLKIASPGVADFYQGTELWTLSLVDPDNRRAVDFARREALLAELEPVHSLTGSARIEALRPLLDEWEDGRIKMFITTVGLQCRRTHPVLFLDGDYTGLTTRGARREHVVALSRVADGHTLIAAVPRLVAGLTEFGSEWPLAGIWDDTRILVPQLPSHTTRFRDLLSGQILQVDQRAGEPSLALGDIMRYWPVALLLSEDI